MKSLSISASRFSKSEPYTSVMLTITSPRSGRWYHSVSNARTPSPSGWWNPPSTRLKRSTEQELTCPWNQGLDSTMLRVDNREPPLVSKSKETDSLSGQVVRVDVLRSAGSAVLVTLVLPLPHHTTPAQSGAGRPPARGRRSKLPTAIKALRAGLLGLVASVLIGWLLPIKNVNMPPSNIRYTPGDNRLTGTPPSSERGGR